MAKKKRGLGKRTRNVLIGLIVFSVIVIFGNLYILNNADLVRESVSGRANSGDAYLTIEFSDNIEPRVVIVDPENTTYTSQRTTLDYIVSDAGTLSTCWYTLDEGETNFTITCGINATGITSSEGSNTWRVYANDTSKNVNSSIVVFTVNLVSVPGAGTGPGTIFKKISDFEVSAVEINLIGVVSQPVDAEFDVINTGETVLTISMEIFGAVYDIPGPDRFSLAPGQRRTVRFVMLVFDPGIYPGIIRLSSSEIIKSVFITGNARSRNEFVGVDVMLNKYEKFIWPGENVKPFVTLKLIGDEIEVEVTYVVKDFEGNELFRFTERLFVDRDLSFDKELPLNDLEPGNYIVGVEIIYDGGFAAASDRFIVLAQRTYVKLIVAVVLGVLALVTILVLISRGRKKKVGRRRR